MIHSEKELINMYLDYVNNFLTVKAFAEYYSMPEAEATDVIESGRILLKY